jgi:hypothetical protein
LDDDCSPILKSREKEASVARAFPFRQFAFSRAGSVPPDAAASVPSRSFMVRGWCEAGAARIEKVTQMIWNGPSIAFPAAMRHREIGDATCAAAGIGLGRGGIRKLAADQP